METRISLITLGVADVARARAFYERLGFVASSDSGEAVAFFQAGGMALGLFGRTDLAADAKTELAAGTGAFSLAQNVRTREEVDATLAAAVVAGARLVKPAEDAFWGGRSGYFADPDGHLWEVAWNPGWTLEADGAITLP